ncbi:HSP90 family protein [Actinomyces howellii]|uniref:High temperature protein G n=1 Tax=Actinomyces howellii TaxID=52771 RepID=A0A448HH77_9ACTO|nr:HSP90 family protein [Actinomyces howellii]VEG28402.1 High temperature protein G [Actinomyces howellii]
MSTDAPSPGQSAFQVDLRGMVDLLSRHLYSGPRVYVRELLQNAVDAVAARQAIEPGCARRVVLTVGEGTLSCRDTGIGLTLAEASSLLSTIGASSKRDELGLARGDYLGQFGIGLLSCFMVSPEIVVRSLSARPGASSTTASWVGRTDGTYSVEPVSEPGRALSEPGTVIELRSLPGEAWLQADTVRSLVDEFGSLLPIDVEVRAADGVTYHGGASGPWEMSRHEARDWCVEELGTQPFDLIDLAVPVSGLQGVAVVVAQAHPTATAHHTAYVKRMLVSRSAEDLAPPWAYFVRVVANSDHLRLTASREQLMDDDLLESTREAVGDAVRSWLERTARLAPARFAEFVAAHAVGLRSVALADEQMLGLVVRHLPVETTEGGRTLTELAEMAAQGRTVRYTRTVDQYRALADVASSQGLVLVNAGYSFEEEVLGAFLARPDLAGADPGISLVDPGELLEAFTPCSPAEEAEAVDLLMVAAAAIDSEDCEVVLRRFEPATLPALYLPDPDLAGRVAARSSRKAASGVWAEVLGVTDPFATSSVPRLVLNRTSSLVARLVVTAAKTGSAGAAPDDTVVQVLRGLYIQCLLAGRQPLGPKERAWASQALTSLLDASLPPLSGSRPGT